MKKSRKNRLIKGGEGEGSLLMISDLEGCAPVDYFSKDKTPQSTLLCENSTFDAIKKFLDTNSNNKVAFLGDYFDMGPGVVNSINRIVKMKQEKPNQVHILFGNRDLNKLRLCYEFDPTLKPTTGAFLTNDANFNNLTKQMNVFERLKLILNTTMGAGSKYNDATMAGLRIHKINDQPISEKQGAYLLLKVFNEESANSIFMNSEDVEKTKIDKDEDCKYFPSNCRQLFELGEIVTYDEYFKVLLSHAGGFTNGSDTKILTSSEYTKPPMNSEEVTFDNYFKVMEDYRKYLLSNDLNDSQDINSLNDVLKAHNGLLKNCVSNKIMFEGTLKPTKEFCLLQAMGLKPKANEPNTFHSFVHSCGLNGGCGLDFNENPALVAKLADYGVQFVASGHQPHCTTVPVIYRKENVVFIANDTSNGYRPKGSGVSLSNFPLSYIQGSKVGICSLQNSGTLNIDQNSIISYDKDGKTSDYYKDLVKTYDISSINDIPTGSNGKLIDKEGNSILLKDPATDPSKFIFNALKNSQSSAAPTTGGKRRSKRNARKSKAKTQKKCPLPMKRCGCKH